MANLINQEEYLRMMTLQEQLNEIMKNPSSVKNKKQVFIEYTSLLSRSLFRAKVQEKERCVVCSSPIGSVVTILDCEHCICSKKCIESLISDQLEGNLTKYEILNCKCGKKISTRITRTAFGGDEKFFKHFSKVSKKYEPKLTCPICDDDKPVSDFITLECEHRYCKNCISTSVEILIQQGNLGNQINCPECLNLVEPYSIIYSIDDSTRKIYEDFLDGGMEEVKERFVRCKGLSGINCNFSQFISVDREVFECKVCNAKFCPKCKSDPHLEMTCEQMLKSLPLSDPFITEQIEKGDMKICPWCNVPVLKNGGYKYYICSSDLCIGKRRFCWDCGKKLNSKNQLHQCYTEDVLVSRIKGFSKKLIFW